MPQTSTATTEGRCRTCHDVATTVVEYRVPDPHSVTGDETSDPIYLLVCHSDQCIDSAEDDAVRAGGLDRYIDVRLLTAGEADAILGQAA